MSQETAYLRMLVKGLQQYYSNAEDAVKIIINSATAAAAASAIGSAVPVLAIPSTVVSCFGAVWVMYGCICKELGIKIGENALKVIASAALSNIATNIAGTIALGILGSFIPGIGTIGAALITFMSVYLAGYVFLKLITLMAAKTNNPYDFSSLSADEIKKATEGVSVPKDAVDAAKKGYKDSGKK